MVKYTIYRIKPNFYEVCYHSPSTLTEFLFNCENDKQFDLICVAFEQSFFVNDMYPFVKERGDIRLADNTYMYQNSINKQKSYLKVNKYSMEMVGEDFEYPFAKILLLTDYHYLVFDKINNISFWLS